jgi:NTE family protein
MKIGLVLSGGGIRGVMHLGVLKAFDEAGIHVHELSGTSAGAIVGAMYSYGHKPVDTLQYIKEIKVLRSLRPSLNGGLLKMDALANVFRKFIPEDNFSVFKIPLTVALTDFTRGKIKYINEGELVLPIMASSCVPVIFEPVQIGDSRFVDGGLMDNLPASVIKNKVDVLLGSHCNPIHDHFDRNNFRKILERSLLIAINGNTQESKKLCELVIEPIPVGSFSGFDLSKADEIFQVGYKHTQNLMPMILKKLEEKAKTL